MSPFVPELRTIGWSQPAPTNMAPGQDNAVVNLVINGIRAIQREQLKTGEIPTYQRQEHQALAYVRTLLLSTFVDDALAEFDLRTRDFNTSVLDIIPHHNHQWFLASVRQIRAGIRSFLAWQEEVRGTWRFFGQNSGIDPDVCTIACAAKVLLAQTSNSQARPSWKKYSEAIERYRTNDGLYYTFLSPQGDGYGWIDSGGYRVEGYDFLVNALVMDYLLQIGEMNECVYDFISDQIRTNDILHGTVNFPNPVISYYLIAKIWRRAQFADFGQISEKLVPNLLTLQQPNGDFGGPLSTAMALSALMDMDYDASETWATRDALMRSALDQGGWPCEDFVVNGYGSPAGTTAIAINSLIRSTSGVCQ